MIYWSPSNSSIEEYVPVGGWNSIFSNKDKIKCTALYTHFKKRGYSTSISNTLAHMILFKEKYKGLYYSKEQEQMLSNVLLTRK